MNKVKVAVIGYGHLGKWHCQKAAQIENSTLMAIVEMSEQGQAMAREAHPDVKVVSCVDEVMSEVDAFIVVTPTSTHASIVSNLLDNKKHIFCEKPLCSNESELAQIESRLDSKLVLQVGHSERCHQAWEILKEKFDAITGKKIIKLNRFAPFKGRATDVDVVQDLMIHDIDLMMYLFGEKPSQIKSYGFPIRTDKYDHVVSHFSFEDGSICEITSGRNSTHEVRELEVVSGSGCYRVDLMHNKWAYATNNKLSNGEYVEEYEYEKRDHLFIEQDLFYKSILTSSDVFVSFTDGKVAVELIDAVIASLGSS
jgi:predicted dehydrogenase